MSVCVDLASALGLHLECVGRCLHARLERSVRVGCVSWQFACGLVEGRSWFASARSGAVARPSVLLFLDRRVFWFCINAEVGGRPT
jgi:hypothetical protein